MRLRIKDDTEDWFKQVNGDIGNTQGLSNLGAKIKSLVLITVKMLIRNSNRDVEESVGYVKFRKEVGPGHRELRVIFAWIAQAGCVCVNS